MTNKNYLFFAALVVIVVAVSAYLLVKPEPFNQQGTNQVPESYSQEIQQIPLETRFPKGRIVYSSAGFNRASMKFGVVPEQQKAQVEIENSSDQPIVLLLNTSPENSKAVKQVNIGPKSSSVIDLSQLGSYIYQEKNTPEHIISFELVEDPDYHP